MLLKKILQNTFVLLALFFSSLAICNAKSLQPAPIINPAAEHKVNIENQIGYIPVSVVNNFDYALSSDKNYFISYHLYNINGKLLKYDNDRTKLFIKPHSNEIINLKIDPLKKGRYYITIDIVKEGAFWFGINKKVFLTVNGYFDNYKRCSENNKKTCWYIEGEKDINYLNVIIKRTYLNSQRDMKNLRIKAFSAGSGYSQQIWIRDSYTILEYSKYLYKEPYLSSWLDYFLNHKTPNGLIYDWFNSKKKFDKNTVEADQESSLALAYFELLRIDKTRYIDKLGEIEHILEQVLKMKQDHKTGLIINAYTIDWGDVQYGANNWQEAVKLNKKSYMVAGIYTNALFYSAVSGMVSIYKNLDKDKFLKWKKIKDRLKYNINKYLWNKKMGFYSINYHITPIDIPFDESNMFAMGGNAVALSTDLVNRKMAKSIIDTAIARQKLFNFSTISGVLLPCYPKGYFKYKAVNDYFEYQNGGQWDWFGGRLVKQMFKHGFGYEAFEKLREIAHKNVENKGIFEWEDMIGEPEGSSNYTGAAGVLGNTIVEGLFGIDFNNGKVYINKIPPIKKKFLLNLHIPTLKKHILYTYNGQCYKIQSDVNVVINKNILKNSCFKLKYVKWR